MNTIYIGIGSNLSDPHQQVSQAIDELQALSEGNSLITSSLYRSRPMGPADQPDYINAVTQLRSHVSPHELLDALQAIEQQHGRLRTAQRWGPRTLDLDLLVYGEQIINDDRLTVPHPGLDQRSFVLYPLYEIAPTLDIPGLGPLQQLVAACDATGLERIEAV